MSRRSPTADDAANGIPVLDGPRHVYVELEDIVPVVCADHAPNAPVELDL